MHICALLLRPRDIFSMDVGTRNAHVLVPILQNLPANMKTVFRIVERGISHRLIKGLITGLYLHWYEAFGEFMLKVDNIISLWRFVISNMVSELCL